MNCTHEEMLISRIVVGEADPADWTSLRTLAAEHPEIWRALSDAHEDHAAVGRLMQRAARLAERVEIDCDARATLTEMRRNSLGRWVGWALAASVLIAWGVTSSPWRHEPGSRSAPAMNIAGAPFLGSARDAYQAYLDQGIKEGLVLSPQPSRVLIRTRPLDDGSGMELVYYLQTIEKSVVPSLYQFRGQDELGRATLVNYEQPAGAGGL